VVLSLGELVRYYLKGENMKPQRKENEQCKEIKRLQGKILDLRDSMEKLQSESKSLTDLIHISLEGIRTESVGIDEIRNAITSLYLLSDAITKQAKIIIKETVL